MPPQQPDRPLDLIDEVLDFRAHRSALKAITAIAAGGSSDCTASAQWAVLPVNISGGAKQPTCGRAQ